MIDMIITYSEATMLFLVVVVVMYCSWIMTRRRSWHESTIKNGGSSLSVLPRNWPVVGMAPAMLWNMHRFHDYITEILRESGGTFELRGPWFTNLDTMVTCDPANIHHIFIKNAANFSKGTNFKKIFEGFGYAFFVSSGKSWEVQRRALARMLNHQDFPKFVAYTTRQKVEKGLIPVLDDCAASSSVVDLQDIIHRFAFDNAIKVGCGLDPASLSVGLPNEPCIKAFDDVMDSLFYRHFFPSILWKLQQSLHIGIEKKLSDGWKIVYEFLDQCISMAREDSGKNKTGEEEEAFRDILTSLTEVMDEIMGYGLFGTESGKLLRDFLLNILLAAKTTQVAALAWFFLLLAENPLEERKIQEEITTNFSKHIQEAEPYDEGRSWSLFISNPEELKKLIYMRAALTEALRLFSPAAIHHKAPTNYDILPSGHRLSPDKRIVVSFYSTGRMENVWGPDCLEFKPSRWITVTKDGKITSLQTEPAHKFPAFSCGPAYCLGKDMAFIQMQIFIATVVYKYEIQVVERHSVSPKNSVVLTTKQGIKVRVTRRK